MARRFPVIHITEGEWTSIRFRRLLGVNIPFFFTNDPAFLADYIANFETRLDDVFVVSYLKSGLCIVVINPYTGAIWGVRSN